MRKNFFNGMFVGIIIIILVACSSDKPVVNPDKPITVDLWHYYNGVIKVDFDALVTEFNETIGKEKGVVVETQSYGEISQLETALFEAANEDVGALPMPDIFAAYSDHAYELAQLTDLVALEEYFTADELATYREEFLEEGQFLEDGKSYILPIAKATENLFVNKTDWDIFAEEYGFTEKDLSTWTSILHVAETYYDATGKAFFSHDSTANFMIMFSQQLGDELFTLDDEGNIVFNLKKNSAREIWQQYFIPYMKGYYEKKGRFSSDDAKTGSVIAFISSTSGAGYFPKEVTFEKDTYEIEPLVLPYPYVDMYDRYAIQQGAGMSIAKSNEAREYGAAVFLKWFTETEQNMEFAIKTGYLPVKNEVYEDNLLMEEVEKQGIVDRVIHDSFEVTNEMLGNYGFYHNTPFSKSYQVRKLLHDHMVERIQHDLMILESKVEDGESRSEVLETLISDEAFESWYTELQEKIQGTLK